jgi:hypothetical protein
MPISLRSTEMSYDFVLDSSRAITRSQSKNNNKIKLMCPSAKPKISLRKFLKEEELKQQKKDVPPKIMLPEETCLTTNDSPYKIPKPESFYKWLNNYINKIFNSIKELNNEKEEIYKMTCIDNQEKRKLLNKMTFNSLRSLTEMYYIINNYAPEMFRENPSCFDKFDLKKLGILINKCNNNYAAIGEDDYNSVKYFIHEFLITKKLIDPSYSETDDDEIANIKKLLNNSPKKIFKSANHIVFEYDD